MTVYTSYIPSDTFLVSGDYLTSPSGTYYATIGTSVFDSQPNFIVSGGSNPTVQPGPGYGVLQATTAYPNTNLGGFYLDEQPDGNVVLYTNGTGVPTQTPYYPTRQSSTQGSGLTFVALTDSGALNIYQGSNPSNQGALLSSSNVAGTLKSIRLTGLTYDFADAQYTSTNSVVLGSFMLANPNPVQQQFRALVTSSYTQSQSFNFAVSNTTGLTISSTATVGVPGIAQSSLGFSVTSSTTITHGQADTTSSTVMFQAGATPEVPAMTTYLVDVTGTEASYGIPYTWTGIGTYQLSGGGPTYTANLVGTGTFDGASEGNFNVTITCEIAVFPHSCDNQLPVTMPADVTILVAEPASAPLLAVALLAAALSRRRLQRSRRPAGGQRRAHQRSAMRRSTYTSDGAQARRDC